MRMKQTGQFGQRLFTLLLHEGVSKGKFVIITHVHTHTVTVSPEAQVYTGSSASVYFVRCL